MRSEEEKLIRTPPRDSSGQMGVKKTCLEGGSLGAPKGSLVVVVGILGGAAGVDDALPSGLVFLGTTHFRCKLGVYFDRLSEGEGSKKKEQT